MKCFECGERRATQEDPRVPPLEVGKCLCRACTIDAIDDRIGDLSTEIEELRTCKEQLEKRLKR